MSSDGSTLTMNNFVTDLLDRMIRDDFNGVYLVPGSKVVFRRQYTSIDTPDLPELIDEEELYDAMAALGLAPDTKKIQEEYIHVSDYFPDIRFQLSVDLPRPDVNLIEPGKPIPTPVPFIQFSFARKTLLVVEYAE